MGILAKIGVKIEIFSKTFASADMTLFPNLQILLAQADGPFGGNNHDPVISNLSADPPSIDTDETSTITCTASDEDVGDTFTYTWTKTGGTITGSGSAIIWTSPSTEGTYTITCTVSDGEGGEDSESINIIVTESEEQPPATVAPIISVVEGADDGYVNADEVAYGLAVLGNGPAYAEIKIYINDICAYIGDVLADGSWWAVVVSELDVDGTKTLYATATEDGLAESAHSNEITFILDTTGSEENDTYTIIASAGSHGSISPSGSITVNQDSDKSFTITPDTGYQIDDVLVDGSSVGAVSSYTFTNVTQDHTISATFIIEEDDSNDEVIFDTKHNPIEIFSNFRVSCDPIGATGDNLTRTWEIPYILNEPITYNEIDHIWFAVPNYACTFTIYCTIDDGINEYSGSLEVEVVNTHEDDTEEIISVIREFELAMNNFNWEKAKSCCVYESSLYDNVIDWEHYIYPELHFTPDYDVDAISIENMSLIVYDPMFFYDDGLEALVIFQVGGTYDGESIAGYRPQKINNSWKLDT